MAALPVNLLAVSTYFEGVEMLSCLRFQPVNDRVLVDITQLLLQRVQRLKGLHEAE